MKIILSKDFSNLKVLDIGTGSGILSICTALKDALEVTALDIRDVFEEVTLNASLNNLQNIKFLVCDVLNSDVDIKDKFDWIFINIGGEETLMFMDFIKKHLKKDGFLLVSGLVEWSYDDIEKKVKEHGFKVEDKYKSNEWCTSIFQFRIEE